MLDYRDFSMDFSDYNTISPDKRKKKKYTYEYECDDIFTFDIEVSSAWIDGNGSIKGYEKGKKESQILTAKNFLEKGIPIDVISECTNIPREIIMELSLNNN